MYPTGDLTSIAIKTPHPPPAFASKIAIPLTSEQTMFNWIRAIKNFPHGAEAVPALEPLVQLAAERSLPAIRKRLTLDCSSMPLAELRGYLRARGWSVVREQTRKLLAERNLPADLADSLMSRTLDRTAHVLARQPVRQPVMPLPAAHVQLRIAG
jgi:hypothetical protein